MSRLSKEEVSEVVTKILGEKPTPLPGNWFRASPASAEVDVYYSQCKPSAASKGKWNYDFFHTLSFETVQNIGVRSGILILMNYIDRTYAVLDSADLMWVVKFSSRNKTNDGLVCDFVIDRDVGGAYNLRPYDRQRSDRRSVEVKAW
jgi:hypothetical protein